jgi:hypothetical protein
MTQKKAPRLVRLKLTRKLAEMLDGVDLSRVNEGDVVDLSTRDARCLIAEGWAVAVEATEGPQGRAEDCPPRKRTER